ncbi:hypothetical protein QC823_12945 [Halomonas vilamensis]|uniref:DUF3108 domain-containing protein n=1 Tax=Vreelandella vilamensis TaxID=531309 RepID=A0ABU1H6G5_9GAMM|nr:hypothetical protein [Halomonas vilamensis]MDR5899895.1 hypothetical protein [Halomonas vilamensis]
MRIAHFCALWLTLVASVAGANNTDTAAPGELQPFEAEYRLEVRGWPSATITHRLVDEGHHWLSDMRFSVAVARGHESSRFTLIEDQAHSLMYESGYSLLGIGDRHHLGEADISSLDRQTTIIDLARRAESETCTQNAPCEVTFVDHRGRDEFFQYYSLPQGSENQARIDVPAGTFDAHSVVLFDVEKPDRQIRISYHADYPGLILQAIYQKDGKRDTQITLTHLSAHGGN